MSDMHFAGRSNTVKVKDIEGLKESLKPFSWLFLFKEQDKYYISAENYDLIFQSALIEVNEEFEETAEIEFDPDIHIIPYLEDKEILIIIEVSNDKLRSIYGSAHAYTKNKNPLYIELDHIHRMIEREWNTDNYDSF